MTAIALAIKIFAPAQYAPAQTRSETDGFERLHVTVDLIDVAQSCSEAFGVQTNIVGRQSAPLVSFAALQQITQHLSAAINILFGVVEISVTAKGSPVVRSNLCWTNCSNVRLRVFAK